MYIYSTMRVKPSRDKRFWRRTLSNCGLLTSWPTFIGVIWLTGMGWGTKSTMRIRSQVRKRGRLSLNRSLIHTHTPFLRLSPSFLFAFAISVAKKFLGRKNIGEGGAIPSLAPPPQFMPMPTFYESGGRWLWLRKKLHASYFMQTGVKKGKIKTDTNWTSVCSVNITGACCNCSSSAFHFISKDTQCSVREIQFLVLFTPYQLTT